MMKECFITTGATAKFTELIRAALSPECLQVFAENGFTHLNFQCGNAMGAFDELKPADSKGIEINGFDFNREGLSKEMRRCQAKAGVSDKGLIICHAGAGTILDAMRLGLTLIVVPNSSLLDNHQVELAEELETQGYAIHSSTKGLSAAISAACEKDQKPWVGATTSFVSIIDQVVGFEEDVRARLD